MTAEPAFIVYDTETTGLYNSRKDYRDETQPWAIQLAFLTADIDFNVIDTYNTLVVPPEGVEFHPKAVAVHGFSEERVRSEGIPHKQALEDFSDACHMVADGGRVAYNIDFDDNVMTSMAMRAHPELSFDQALDALNGRTFRCCAMEAAIAFLRRRDANGALRRIKLVEAYRAITGYKMPDAHDALGDVKGALAVLKGIYEMTADMSQQSA